MNKKGQISTPFAIGIIIFIFIFYVVMEILEDKRELERECKQFRCYYSSDTGGSLQIEYVDLGCPDKWLEMDLFYVECKS